MKQREKRNPKKRDRKKQIDDDVVHHDDLGFPSSSAINSPSSGSSRKVSSFDYSEGKEEPELDPAPLWSGR